MYMYMYIYIYMSILYIERGWYPTLQPQEMCSGFATLQLPVLTQRSDSVKTPYMGVQLWLQHSFVELVLNICMLLQAHYLHSGGRMGPSLPFLCY